MIPKVRCRSSLLVLLGFFLCSLLPQDLPVRAEEMSHE